MKIELYNSFDFDSYWIKIFNEDYLKINSLKRINGAKIAPYVNKEIITFKTIKTGKIRLLFIENGLLGPCKEIKYNINITD